MSTKFYDALQNFSRHACPADCECARGASKRRSSQPVGSTKWCMRLSVVEYLALVYPTATWSEDARIADLFASLHYVYEHRCLSSQLGCRDVGALLRFLYDGLLPCTAWPTYKRVQEASLRSDRCLEKHFAFTAPWATDVLVQGGFVEVEHRVFGLGLSDDALPAADGYATVASDFLDAGVAGMWYILRPGSGIFYELGTVAVAPGKNAMVARLLVELAHTKPHLDPTWRSFAAEKWLFRTRQPPSNRSRAGTPLSAWASLQLGSGGALQDADRIRSTANGSRTCDAAHVRWCRCRFILADHWDEAMVWLARALGYDTLALTATLLPRGGGCVHASVNESKRMVDDEAPVFAAAYPELVDVRPLTDARWSPTRDAASDLVGRDHDHVVGSTARSQGGQGAQTVFTWRKRPDVATAFVARMRRENRLTLRDPLDPHNAARTAPCNFSVTGRQLACAGHVSARLPQRRGRPCTQVMCGQHAAWPSQAQFRT